MKTTTELIRIYKNCDAALGLMLIIAILLNCVGDFARSAQVNRIKAELETMRVENAARIDELAGIINSLVLNSQYRQQAWQERHKLRDTIVPDNKFLGE